MNDRTINTLRTPGFTARLLGVSRSTLRRWRRTGRGPRHVRRGFVVRYSDAAIAAWLNEPPSAADIAEMQGMLTEIRA